ncbi:hypothetical protein KPH14_005621 [Odynerus spinipes]|uniref:Lipocalin/cytosolic fatty-acid binding domain-containing protein n=1 Tax=Odynerus spinipes TaxID=1348599 RepID=A0AAD9RAR5_9HYME|nr:hypothetical protein KPH14_005621 [Odynerus spinipes]
MKSLWTGDKTNCNESAYQEHQKDPLCNNHLSTSEGDAKENKITETSTDFISVDQQQGDEKNALQNPPDSEEVTNKKQGVETYLAPLLRQFRFGIEDMAPIVGTYQHERNENLDEYFKALGVPYIARKMMGLSSPRLEILNEGEKWTIRTVSMMRTLETTFVLGEEYEETMPSGETLKNVTTMDDDSLVTVSYRPDNSKIVRKYDFNDDSVILTMSYEKSDAVAKRYYKRL